MLRLEVLELYKDGYILASRSHAATLIFCPNDSDSDFVSAYAHVYKTLLRTNIVGDQVFVTGLPSNLALLVADLYSADWKGRIIQGEQRHEL
jgi:hypothetical protein